MKPPAGAPGALGNSDTDKPMLYMFSTPDSIRTGTAVLICPGGGYTGLPGFMGYEGINVAKWFNSFAATVSRTLTRFESCTRRPSLART